MSNIFTTNSQAERYLGLQQRAAVRSDDLGAGRAERSAGAGAGSSNAEFLKARADARVLERARDNDAARSSAIENSPQAASERPANASAAASERPTYDRSDIGAETSRAADEQNRLDSIEDDRVVGEGSLSRSSGTHHNEKAVALSGNDHSGENSPAAAKTTQPGGSEVGPLSAYQNQNGTGKKADVSPGKVAGAYETVANSGSEDAAASSDTETGELPKLVNAMAGAYISESSEEGEQAAFDGQAVVAGEELAGILELEGEASDPDGVNIEILENAGQIVDSENSEIAGGEGKGGQAAGKDAGATAAASAATLKTAYVEAHTEEKGVEKEDGEDGKNGKDQVTQKTSDSSPKKTAPQRIVPPGGEQLNMSTEELALDLSEAVDSAELVEAVTGKEQQGGQPGFTKDNGAGGSKPDTAAMKNDGKAEGMVQVKNANTGVEAAKKATAAPKTLSNFGKLQEGVFNAVDRGIRLSLASGGQDAKLTLRPESLGELRIKLSIGENGQVQSKIMVDNATVKSILDNDAARLKGMFSEQGLDLESFSVEVGGGWSGQSAKGGGSGFDLNGRGAQRAYSDGGGAQELDISVMAESAYGSVGGGGLDLFA